MAFMTKGLASTTRTPAATRPPSCSCTARAVTTELVAAGSGVRRRYRCITVDQRGFGQSPDLSGGPGPAALATDAIAPRASRNRARRARRPVDGRLGGGARPCGRRSGSGRSPWPTRSAISPIPRSPACASGSPPRAAAARRAVARGDRPDVPQARAGTLVPLRADLRVERPVARRLPRAARAAHHAGRRLRRHAVPTLFLTSDEDGLIWPELSQKVHEARSGSRFVRRGGGPLDVLRASRRLQPRGRRVPQGASAMKWCRYQSGKRSRTASSTAPP